MSLPEDSAEKKWSCVYCTYENYQASKKCTICRSSRTPKYISLSVDTPSVQDIYQLTPLVCDENKPIDITIPKNVDPNPIKKWACQQCTYLNWPNLTKCTQCFTPRDKSQLTVSNTSNSEDLPKNVDVRLDQSTDQSSKNNSPKTSPKSSPEVIKEINNDLNKTIASTTHQNTCTASKLIKWTCKACTYENWPKSNKCVICRLPKGKSPGESTSIGNESEQESGSNSSDNEMKKSVPNTSKYKRKSAPASRPSSARSNDSNDIYHLGGATASPSPILGADKSDKNTPNLISDNKHGNFSGTSSSSYSSNNSIRQIRNIRDTDWLWLNACKGVVDGDIQAVEAYLSANGDAGRQLTAEECALLSRPSAFQAGYTLVHLALRFQGEDLLTALLTTTEVVKKAKKRMPSHIAPDIAREIQRDISIGIRRKKGDFPCSFLSDIATFSLPTEIEEFPVAVKKQLFQEVLDEHAQKELEEDEPVINWSDEITERLGSRLYALWNRQAGDCLLDSVLQASYGVFDSDNLLRQILADSLVEGANMFFPRWKECEALLAASASSELAFSLDENQWRQDWAILLSLASQPGSSLEHLHIFVLAHVLRRPIVVYGIKFVKSFRGENLGLTRFQGVYLPLLWEQSFCWKTPIALGYTRGHFSALVPMEMDISECVGAGAHLKHSGSDQIAYLPLIDCEGKVLPIHFLPASDIGREEVLLKEWLVCCLTDGGLLVAQQKIDQKPILVKQMLNDWLDRYRRMAHMVKAKSSEKSINTGGKTKANKDPMSSDDESDDE